MKKRTEVRNIIISLSLVIVLVITGMNVPSASAASKILTGTYTWDKGDGSEEYCSIYIQKKSAKKVKVAVWGWSMTAAFPAKTKTVKNGKITYKAKSGSDSVKLTIRFQGKKLKCTGKNWDGGKLKFTAKRVSSEKPDFSHLYFDF